ncbi:STAS domain-containing protein [Streptomyces sp. NPDC005141]
MTPPAGFESAHLRLITAPSADDDVVHLEVHGFLDYDSAEQFLAGATRQLAGNPGLRALHLDCTGLDGIDSMGLAMLLMLHRRTTSAHVVLHLDGRPPALERMLDITGTLDHLVPGGATGTGGHAEPRRMAYRHTPDHGTPVDDVGQEHRLSGPDTRG